MTKTATQFAPASTVAFGSVTSSYTAFGSKFPFPVQGLSISMSFDHPVWLSTDGVTDMIYVNATYMGLPALGDYSFLFQNGLPSGTQFYIKYDTTAPTAGKLAVMASGRAT